MVFKTKKDMDSLNIEKQGLVSGLAITTVLIAFFFLMKAVGLIHQYELRALNAIIMFTGVFLTIRAFKKNSKNFSYLKGMSLGLLTSLSTAISFAVFVLLFVLSSPAFMEMIKANEPHGIYINEYGIAIVIFIEAAASGLIFSFLSMQWLKEKSFTKYRSGYFSH